MAKRTQINFIKPIHNTKASKEDDLSNYDSYKILSQSTLVTLSSVVGTYRHFNVYIGMLWVKSNGLLTH